MPDLYSHVRVIISIIVGLCITTLLNGFARFVQHPRRDRVSLLHIGWAASLLLWIIHFWWWEFRLALVQQWTFARYSFVILYATLFYFLCTLLFPSNLKDYSGYENYFLSRRRWFFGFLAATFLADIVDYQDQGLCLLALLRSRIPNSHCRKHGAVHGWNVYGRPANSAGTARRLVALSCLSDYGRLQYSIRPADTPASQAGTLERAVFLDRDEQLRSQKAGNHVEARS